MSHRITEADREFRRQFESCEIQAGGFDHRGHLRLAYIYLTEQDTETAVGSMRDSLHHFLGHHQIDPQKYHETITRAWIMAVRHFMEKTEHADSADDFIDQNPEMLDANIMLTHYSANLLFSDEARRRFVEPDRDPLPKYER